jgi:hypothetical protein
MFRYIRKQLTFIKNLFFIEQKTSITKKPNVASDKEVPHNMGKKDMIRATDFNFLMVLGKGSFGKVCFFLCNNTFKYLRQRESKLKPLFM